MNAEDKIRLVQRVIASDNMVEFVTGIITDFLDEPKAKITTTPTPAVWNVGGVAPKKVKAKPKKKIEPIPIEDFKDHNKVKYTVQPEKETVFTGSTATRSLNKKKKDIIDLLIKTEQPMTMTHIASELQGNFHSVERAVKSLVAEDELSTKEKKLDTGHIRTVFFL